MNKKILGKVNAELVKETPDLSYIRGMIEVMLAMEDTGQVNSKPAVVETPTISVSVPTDRILRPDELKAIGEKAMRLNPTQQAILDAETNPAEKEKILNKANV